jgi:multicomponent Na+:H+ antiporter subunit A
VSEDRGRVTGEPRQRWLGEVPALEEGDRSVALEFVTRLVFHSVLVYSVYLLFAGHNAPGGGFVGGLVAGLALTLRYVAAGRYALHEVAPVDPGLLLGGGMVLAGGAGLAPWLAGRRFLESVIVEFAAPIYGPVKLVSSVAFDVGVYLLVVGVILDILRALGTGIDEGLDA